MKAMMVNVKLSLLQNLKDQRKGADLKSMILLVPAKVDMAMNVIIYLLLEAVPCLVNNTRAPTK